MRPKDYYKTLEVPAAATPEEIKKSFRRLALQYHPDKNTDNPFAAAHFRDIKEAYSILSDPARRRAYDEDRWLSGMGSRARDQVRITPDWVLLETSRLRRHMEFVDTYRMSHAALRDYVLLLLSDEHMAILHRAGDAERNAAIIRELLAASHKLKRAYLEPVSERLFLLAGKDEAAVDSIRQAQLERRREDVWDQYFPLAIVIAVLLICFISLLMAHFQ